MNTPETQPNYCILCFHSQPPDQTTNTTTTCTSCSHTYCTICSRPPHDMRIYCPGSNDQAPRHKTLIELFTTALHSPAGTMNITKEMWVEVIKSSGDYDVNLTRDEWIVIILKEFGTTLDEVLVDPMLCTERDNERDMKEFYEPLIERLWRAGGGGGGGGGGE